ncbi:MAG: GtrA family protein [Gammaproteobacteria bacterium]|nr:GtrA family protein [Gammaproteobacteria bacterium]
MIQIIKFLGVGAIATAIQYLLLILFVELDLLDPVSSSGLSYSISAVFNYFANYYITFSSDVNHRVAAIKFLVIVLFGLVINTGMMYIMVTMFELQYILAQIIATCIVLVWNFLSHKYWTFVRN